jgi:hypothetical protein
LRRLRKLALAAGRWKRLETEAKRREMNRRA